MDRNTWKGAGAPRAGPRVGGWGAHSRKLGENRRKQREMCRYRGRIEGEPCGRDFVDPEFLSQDDSLVPVTDLSSHSERGGPLSLWLTPENDSPGGGYHSPPPTRGLDAQGPRVWGWRSGSTQIPRPQTSRAWGVNVVRAWPVPDLGSTKAAFSPRVYVCVGGAARLTSVQWSQNRAPVACRHRAPSPSGNTRAWGGLWGLRGKCRRVMALKHEQAGFSRTCILLGTPHSG